MAEKLLEAKSHGQLVNIALNIFWKHFGFQLFFKETFRRQIISFLNIQRLFK